jgi:hypothetical protein
MDDVIQLKLFLAIFDVTQLFSMGSKAISQYPFLGQHMTIGLIMMYRQGFQGGPRPCFGHISRLDYRSFQFSAKFYRQRTHRKPSTKK